MDEKILLKLHVSDSSADDGMVLKTICLIDKDNYETYISDDKLKALKIPPVTLYYSENTK